MRSEVNGLTDEWYWEAIRDQQVRRAELRAQIETVRLREARQALEDERASVVEEIRRMGESQASMRAHEVMARRWLTLSTVALVIATASAWWSFGYLTSALWERIALSLTLVAVPLIGWSVFLFVIEEHTDAWDLRKVLAGLALVILVASIVAAACLGAVRMMGASLEDEYRRTREEQVADRATEARIIHVETVMRQLRTVGIVALTLVAIASEVAAGLAFHEHWRHSVVVRTVRPFYRRLARITVALIENAVKQETLRNMPQMLHARLTVAGLHRQRQKHSLMPTVRWVVVGTAILVVSLLVAAVAFGDGASELTVVIPDLSTSILAAELKSNLLVVESVIRSLPAGRSRLVVLGVTAASFSEAPLFTTITPSEGGTFGEILSRWQLDTISSWRKISAQLRPTAHGSDILGALARATIELDEEPYAMKRVVLLGDMRQVGRGLDLERPFADPKTTAARAYRETPVTLTGVEVNLLGVHTAGISDRHWHDLRAFWTEYFRLAGAELRTLSPNRRLPTR